METYTRIADTGTIEHRHYNPQVVTNIFAENEVLEWVSTVWGDEHGNDHATFEAATIIKITDHYVTLKIYGSDEIIRKSRPFLANRVDDYDLGKIINEPFVGVTDPKKSSKKKKHQTTPFVVYVLSDPRDNTARYIGISKNMERRLKEHLACVGLNFKKNIWIQDLLMNGLTPILTIIESDVIGLELAKNRERYWIHHYLNQNAPLTNIAEMEEVEE
jgi:hypothetical protein